MTVDARRILDEYLVSLEAELRELSPSDRAEIGAWLLWSLLIGPLLLLLMKARGGWES